MVFARYTKSKRHKKLKNVDPSAKPHGQPQTDPRKAKKRAIIEKLRIQKMAEQHIPKKLAHLMDFQNNPHPKKSKPKRNSQSLLKIVTNLNDGDDVGATRPLKEIPKTLQQGQYESQTSFLRRLDKLCVKVRSETNVDVKFNLGEDVVKDKTKISNRILRRRERDKKRKSKKKKSRYEDDDKFNTTETKIFLPA